MSVYSYSLQVLDKNRSVFRVKHPSLFHPKDQCIKFYREAGDAFIRVAAWDQSYKTFQPMD